MDKGLDTPLNIRMSDVNHRHDESKRILYVQFTNPALYPPLEHSSRILADDGWQVMFLGTGALNADHLCFSPHERIKTRLMPFVNGGWRQKLSYLKFLLWTLGWSLRWRPQWVYASDFLSAPAALLLSYLPGTKVVYHEHDSPGANDNIFQRFCLTARRRLTRRAKMSILPNQKRAEIFSRDVAEDSAVLCVSNCPSMEEIAEPRSQHNGQDFWILYHGSIVPPRMPLTVIDALAHLPERMKLRIIGYETVGYRGYVQQILAQANRLGLGHRVEYLGTIPERNALLEWCRRCDVGLAFMPKKTDDVNEQHMVGASNKPFDYLSSGLALLVSDLQEWRATYVEAGYALSCDPENPESIAAALRWFFEHPDEMRAMGERGRRKVATEWNYETQFGPVLSLMNETAS